MHYIIVKPTKKDKWVEADSIHKTDFGKQQKLAIYTTETLANKECARVNRATKENFTVKPISNS